MNVISPKLASFESDLAGSLFGFFTKTITLLRESSLDDDQKTVVGKRINTLIDDAKAEMERTKQLDLTEPLQAVYDEIKRLVDELSESSRAEQ